jgi:hypothetical protein
MARTSNLTMCSFCGKSHAEVLRLVAGPGVYICDRCITVSIRLLDRELTKNAHQRLADSWRTLKRHVVGPYRTSLEWFQKHVLAKLPSLPSADTEHEEERTPATASFTFRYSKKYQFEIDLDFAQRLLRNTTIGKSFYAIGFTDVSVVGSGSKRVVEVGWLRDDATVTVRMIPGEIDRSWPGFALAQLLEGIGNAEEVQPPTGIPSKR